MLPNRVHQANPESREGQPASELDRPPFSTLPFSENDLGPNPAGADPQKSRPRRPPREPKKGISLIDLSGWGFYPPPTKERPESQSPS